MSKPIARKELIAQAKADHDAVCSCDPRYLLSCSRMAAAILALGREPLTRPERKPPPTGGLADWRTAPTSTTSADGTKRRET